MLTKFTICHHCEILFLFESSNVDKLTSTVCCFPTNDMLIWFICRKLQPKTEIRINIVCQSFFQMKWCSTEKKKAAISFCSAHHLRHVFFLRNHCTFTCGRTALEAFHFVSQYVAIMCTQELRFLFFWEEEIPS